MFRAVHVTRSEKSVEVEISTLTDDDLGPGDVTLDVRFSGINYKDAMAMAGNPGVMRTSPLIPGIDLVGTVSSIDTSAIEADASGPAVGDTVIVNGCGIGETHNGGLSERARVSSAWLVPVPTNISPAQAAAIGTAGFTAALAVLALERGSLASSGSADAGLGGGDILVTGATGGVGSIAIILLAAAGYRVVAATGRAEKHGDYLLGLGAAEVIDRSELEEASRPLQKQRWAGVIDSVGGRVLASAIAQTVYGGTVAACGMAGGTDLPTTVMPFILRGVNLAGINSVDCPRDVRLNAWDRLARDLDLGLLDSLTTTVSLADAPATGERLLAGELHGRTVVDVRA
ncbi:MAG TPA: MDR family oxidoreductase [Glaciihabitans sp.]|jgi:acrylyl-CoA reductase (NADPH)|nr:MDR family oxidoreductase [Glaciihabitans sp.]